MASFWDGLLAAFKSALEFLHGLTGNYGLAIVLLTIALRFLFWPLTYAQVLSTRRMQALQPEIEKLRKKYKNDQARMNQEMVKLWRENKVNPASGCLPLLIQLPFLWAIYQSILKFDAFKGAAFLWIPNLAARDPLFLLPVLAGVTTFFQMRMVTPSGGSQQPAQQMMLWFFPIMIAFITISLPAGVGIYWVVSNLFTILQQWIIPMKPQAPGGKAGA